MVACKQRLSSADQHIATGKSSIYHNIIGDTGASKTLVYFTASNYMQALAHTYVSAIYYANFHVRAYPRSVDVSEHLSTVSTNPVYAS